MSAPTSTHSDWTLRQLTTGAGRYHQHSYYDINIFDDASRRIAACASDFQNRDITPQDRIDVGYVDTGDGDRFVTVGTSGAFSLQQGPMAQWVTGSERMIWNDREGDRFVARLHDTATGQTRTLDGMVYAVSPDGSTGLSLNMARLDTLRPGYGYVGGAGDRMDDHAPDDDGVWHVDLATGARRLIVPLERARRFVMKRLGLRVRWRHHQDKYHYWFNHAKISPDGKRFTVKLRWRRKGGPWNDSMGVSLTAALDDGSDLRLLARGTSHVIWQDPQTLYFYRADPQRAGANDKRGHMHLVRDTAPTGTPVGTLAGEVIHNNVHIRDLPGQPGVYVYDTPYLEEVGLHLFDAADGSRAPLATFSAHVPARGPFRCDLHPVPSHDGQHIVVTSLHDGGRQIYLLSKTGA